MLLNNKVTIVTGGASGIGEATSRRFAQEGAAVVVADTRLGKAETVAADINDNGGHAVAIEVDVADTDSVAALVDFAVTEFGRLDVMFNNAGTLRPGTVLELDVDDWDLVMAVNVRSVYLGGKFAIPAMLASGGGSIITVPVMIFLGVPGPIANGTNRIAILAQNIAAISTFKRHGLYDFKLAFSLAACALPGALVGAWVGVNLSGERFNQVLAGHLVIDAKHEPAHRPIGLPLQLAGPAGDRRLDLGTAFGVEIGDGVPLRMGGDHLGLKHAAGLRTDRKERAVGGAALLAEGGQHDVHDLVEMVGIAAMGSADTRVRVTLAHHHCGD